MTDLEKLAAEAMAELVDAKCVDCEDGEAGLLGTSIPVLSKYLEKAHAAGRIEGLKEAAELCCPHCLLGEPYEHNERAYFWHPIEKTQFPCGASAIRARIQELESK